MDTNESITFIPTNFSLFLIDFYIFMYRLFDGNSPSVCVRADEILYLAFIKMQMIYLWGYELTNKLMDSTSSFLKKLD